MSRDFDAAERTWEMQSLARHYGRPEPEEDERISVTVYGPDGEVLADTRQVTWNGRKATVLDEYLDELKRGESLLDADTLEALLRGRRPDSRGRMDVELTAEEAKTLRPNPLKRRKGESERDFMARCMSAEKRKFPQPKQRVAVCLSKARRNPAVQGGSGQYRLHYMEPGKRSGTWRRAIRKVDSVTEAKRWMDDNAGRVKLPAYVTTPGNRYQEPETVAILGTHPSHVILPV